MAGNDDVLGKADALLRRSSGTPAAPGSETGAFPVLTDFVDVAGSEDATVIAGEVSMQVMATVEARLTEEIERKVAAQVTSQLQIVVANALIELRPELANIVAHVVAEAMAKRGVK
jgi:hypothetical protein